jgi:hypothetical protein
MHNLHVSYNIDAANCTVAQGLHLDVGGTGITYSSLVRCAISVTT